MVNSKQFCPECEAVCQFHVETRPETLLVRGTPIKLEADVVVCDCCGQTIENETLDASTLAHAYQLYRQRYNVLDPDQIRELREAYGLSQRAFTRLLGWGDMTIHRYEGGALPDSVHSDLLTMLRDDAQMSRYIHTHGDRLTPLDRRRVEEAISARQREGSEVSLRRVLEGAVSQYAPIERGNTVFELDRFANMVVFFTTPPPGRPNSVPTETKLNKLLFYSDFLAYKRTSRSLSGSAYVRHYHGPVPVKYKSLLEELEQDDIIESEEVLFSTQEGPQTGMEYRARVSFDASMFDEREMAVLRNVSDTFVSFTAKQLRNRSHEEAAWKETEHKHLIPYTFADRLSLD
ncbi:MAG TPA: type II TA system antitoxin MqsA family protein [Chloroflexota bacterium]|nr:type II TA system antitoxin MqsA family protein [Chloroflexota bacterium]